MVCMERLVSVDAVVARGVVRTVHPDLGKRGNRINYIMMNKAESTFGAWGICVLFRCHSAILYKGFGH